MSEINSSEVIYKDIPGWPGYRAGSDGTIWTCRVRGHLMLSKTWKRKKPTRDKGEYLFVGLFNDGRSQRKAVHQLVLEAFVGPRQPGMWARHFPDPCPSNNTIGNLSWATPSENAQDKIAHGTSRGFGIGNAKLTRAGVIEIRRLAALGMKHGRIASLVGVHRVAVGDVIRGKTWADVCG